MADPTTMIAVGGMAATAIGGLVGAMGSSYTGQAQAAAYNYKAGLATVNSQIAKQNADYEIATGEVEAQQSGMKTREMVGQEKAIAGASGLDVNTGSKAAVVQSTEEIGGENQAVIRSNAARRAYGYDVQALQFEAESQLDKGAATMAKTAGDIGAVSTILGTMGSLGSKYIQGKQIGLYG
jgi:hypothetical protein